MLARLSSSWQAVGLLRYEKKVVAMNVPRWRELADSAIASMIPNAIDSDDIDPIVETVNDLRDFLKKNAFAESFKAV